MTVAILGLTSCEGDPILNNEIPPTSSLIADAVEADLGETITLTISGAQGDAAMDLLTITEDGTTIDLSRIMSTDIVGNPAALLGDNTVSFSFIVEVAGPPVAGLYSYAANISDANNNSDGASVNVTVLEEAATPPSIEYIGSDPREVNLGANIFNISATPGSSDLSTIAVFEDGELINPARLSLNGVDFDVNPFSLEGDDVTGFDMADVLVDFTEGGTSNLTFEVIDINGESASVEVSVVAGTPISNSFVASLLSNADGPANILGGLDLDTGANVSVNSDDADIIDLGLDGTTGEWRQQIEGANGTTLRAADPGNPELFNFVNINSREAIIAAFDSGISAEPSNTVGIGDVFIANRGGDFFIMTVTAITVTPNDNEDFYLFDIKSSIQ